MAKRKDRGRGDREAPVVDLVEVLDADEGETPDAATRDDAPSAEDAEVVDAAGDESAELAEMTADVLSSTSEASPASPVEPDGRHEPVAEIVDAIERVNRVRPELEDLRRDIVTAVEAWLVSWWDEQVRHAIENDPWLVLDELGEQGVVELKSRVEQLKGRAPALVKRRLGLSELWVHRYSIDDLIPLAREGLDAFERPYALSGHGVQRVEEVLRQMAGELGPLLVRARLARYHKGADPGGGAWRKADEGGVRYMKTMSYPHALTRAMETYQHHVSSLFIAVRDLDDLRRAHARQQAIAMWDEA